MEDRRTFWGHRPRLQQGGLSFPKGLALALRILPHLAKIQNRGGDTYSQGSLRQRFLLAYAPRYCSAQ